MANPHRTLQLLLSPLYPGSLAPEHLLDLRKSGLANETIRRHRLMSVPPALVRRLLGFDPKAISSAMLLPFPDPRGGFFDHIRLKVFPPFKDTKGNTVKYLQPKASGVRLFFPLLTIEQVAHGSQPLWLVEGEKKSLAVAQLGLPSVGFCGIEGWHHKGSSELLADFAHLHLRDRLVELVPDGDVQTNPDVRRGAERFAAALAAQGARPRLVVLPQEIAA